MLKQPCLKYRPFEPIPFPERTWPNKTIETAPLWASTDLRDGNQALFEPMDKEKKLCLFNLLTQIGFKEIEVGFPSASKADYVFVRELIEKDLVPEDVRIGAITQAREELIRTTMKSLKGAKNAIIHIYAATAPSFRDKVFQKSKAEIMENVVTHVRLARELTNQQPETDWVLEFSPEAFTQTELPYARDVCDAVIEAWGATPEHKMILTLAATVECSSPNCYADQIEWMGKNLKNRASAIFNLHPHNDRGCAVAATEMGLMAGGERVEGCLLANGERTGNVDLVTLALNLYTQGIDPELDLSNLPEIVKTVEACTNISTHPRHPYAGELVFTAFAGSHQDAIKKGLAAQENETTWDVPYLPVDPKDLGRSYESVIRVNSQSGKSGVAYVLEKEHGVHLTKEMQVAFSKVVQKASDETGREINAAEIKNLFDAWQPASGNV